MTGNGRDPTPHGFPWGSNSPTRRQRFAVAAIIATFAAVLIATEYARNAGHHSDFGMAWFGARSILSGVDPWPLVGPGLEFDWKWPLLYPAPALIVAAPLSWLPESAAATSFVWASSFLLAWGATRDSWHRLPAFASLPFLVASTAAQWSALLASTWFIAPLAGVWIAKPTLGFALAASARSRKQIGFAIGGAAVLVGISFIVQPSWLGSWIAQLGATTHMRPPVTHWGGIAIAACALRWRRPEARLLLALALVPQTPAAYDLLLILVIVPDTYHESVGLSLVCTLGLLLANIATPADENAFIGMRGTLNVAACYLPATILILRRPNQATHRFTPVGVT